MKRPDSGYILPMTIVTLTLLAYAALLTGRTFGVLLRASTQERLVLEERFTTRNAEQIIDAWMSDQEISAKIVAGDTAYVAGADLSLNQPARFSHVGEPNCAPPDDTACWWVEKVEDVSPTGTLRGGEAEQQLRAITFTVGSGCFDDLSRCQRTSSITRTYERAVFSQYQLHYDTNQVPLPAIYGLGEMPDDPRCVTDKDTYTGTCDDPPVTYGGDEVPDDPRCVTDPTYTETTCDGYNSTTVIVFSGEDTLKGPVRTTLKEVLYCGDPDFYRVEVSGEEPSPPTSPLVSVSPTTCPTVGPQWIDKDGNSIIPHPQLSDLLTSGALVYGGDLSLPTLETPPTAKACTLSQVNYSIDLDRTATDLRITNREDTNDTNDCPGEPGSTDPHAILDGDLIVSPASITIKRLEMVGSATIHAEGDIIICGDIETKGHNPAGGLNVIALITEGDVILDPSGLTPPACGDDTISELSILHNLKLTNIAVLAPDGAVYARRWHLPHAAAGGPGLTIEGSIAAAHLGLYGIPDAATGTITAGWIKNFTYPTDFWRARPPWWPEFSPKEWRLVH